MVAWQNFQGGLMESVYQKRLRLAKALRDRVFKLRGQKWTMDRIAEKVGVTRQRIHQILNNQ